MYERVVALESCIRQIAMQEIAFNLGYTRIKKNREFRKENNNLSIVVSSKRMRERERKKKYKKMFLLVEREGNTR